MRWMFRDQSCLLKLYSRFRPCENPILLSRPQSTQIIPDLTQVSFLWQVEKCYLSNKYILTNIYLTGGEVLSSSKILAAVCLAACTGNQPAINQSLDDKKTNFGDRYQVS